MEYNTNETSGFVAMITVLAIVIIGGLVWLINLAESARCIYTIAC
jgi:hypothetical protein